MVTEETKILNFVVNALRTEHVLKKALVEYDVPIPSDSVRPDLFCFLSNENDVLMYFIIDIKNHSSGTRDPEELQRITSQKQKFSQIRYDLLDSLVIPAVDAPVHISYMFYDTQEDYIKSLAANADFGKNIGILSYTRQMFPLIREEGQNPPRYIERSIKFVQVPDSAEFQRILQVLIDQSENLQYWRNMVLPFTKEDLVGLRGKGGSPDAVTIDLSVPVSILISHLATFVIQRRVRSLPATFTAEEFLDFLCFPVRGVVEFGEEDRAALLKRLRLFLNVVTATCATLEVVFITRDGKNFQVAIRKTQTLTERINDIGQAVRQKLEELQKQRKLDVWFPSPV